MFTDQSTCKSVTYATNQTFEIKTNLGIVLYQTPGSPFLASPCTDGGAWVVTFANSGTGNVTVTVASQSNTKTIVFQVFNTLVF